MATTKKKTTATRSIVKTTKTNKKPVKKTSANRLNFLRSTRAQVAVFAVTFGVIGTVLLVLSHADSISTWNTYANGLRQCESTNTYNINTGNGHYGAYQFDHSTWASVGGTAYAYNANTAPKNVQDYFAFKLYKSRGFNPWQCWTSNLYPSRVAWWGNPNHNPSTGSLTVVPAPKPSSPTPVSCSTSGYYGNTKYQEHWCHFTPVPTPLYYGNTKSDTFSHQSYNWILCQQKSSVTFTRYAGVYNYWWGYTLSDQGHWRWVNATYTTSGDNNGSFGGTPICSSAGINTSQAGPVPAVSHP